MTPERSARVADFIRAELAAIVQKEMRDPRVALLTVTDVRVGRDLGRAEVFVSSLTTTDAAAQAALEGVLNRAAGFLRNRLAARGALRATPRLRFRYDDSLERGPRIDALLAGLAGASRPAPVDAPATGLNVVR